MRNKHLFLSIICGLLMLLCSVPVFSWTAYNPNPIIDYRYTYDQVGNITKIDDKVNIVNSQGFTYDEVDRLTQATGQYGVEQYNYDSVGNINTGILPGSPLLLGKDNNGNITSYSDGTRDLTIVYDYENRPISITNKVTNVQTTFAYDYSGQRVKKRVVKLGTITQNDPNYKVLYVGNIYEETITATEVTNTRYMYAGSMRVASVVKNGNAVNTYYYHSDHLGSSSIMTDESGNKAETVSYKPWGEAAKDPASTFDTAYKFTGQILDDYTGLYYYGARYYDPVLRRFISPDTIVRAMYDPQSLNRYAYCQNNPVLYNDPSGHCPLIFAAMA